MIASNKLPLNFDNSTCCTQTKANPRQPDFVQDIGGKKLFPETLSKYLGIG